MSEMPKLDDAAIENASGGSGNAKSRVELVSVNLTVNCQSRTIALEPRTTLLDDLREKLALTGTKKACDRGECGACTVHIDGRRILSCMTLAAMQEGKGITAIDGLERNGRLRPVAAAISGVQAPAVRPSTASIATTRCADGQNPALRPIRPI
jgi:xanthine dehydrogenase YagT iron-sulfur-binding subunit